MTKIKSYDNIIGKKIVVFLGNQPHIGILNMYDDENLRLMIGDEESNNPIPYLLPRSKITIIGEDADAILKIMNEAQEKAAAKAAEKNNKPQIITQSPAILGL